MSGSHRPLWQAIAQHASVRDIQSLPDTEFTGRLPSLLQQALRREHSLIPPLLAARLSLKPAANRALSILLEEAIASQMRRMALAAKLQIAIGGQPRVALPGFVPAYPSSPPLAPEAPAMGIEPFSLRLLRDVLLPQIALCSDGENRHEGAAGFYRSLQEGFQQCHK
ncbi:ferritin-like domain-containing protein, partial [Chromobacterium piscinae]